MGLQYPHGSAGGKWVGALVGKRGDERTYVKALLHDPCTYCDAPATTLDHIVPESAGGDSEWDNLTPACSACNASKGHRSLLGVLAYWRTRAEQRAARAFLAAESVYLEVGRP